MGAKGCGLKTVWIKEVNQKDDPGDQDHQPDATVPELGQVVAAIQRLVSKPLFSSKTPPGDVRVVRWKGTTTTHGVRGAVGRTTFCGIDLIDTPFEYVPPPVQCLSCRKYYACLPAIRVRIG